MKKNLSILLSGVLMFAATAQVSCERGTGTDTPQKDYSINVTAGEGGTVEITVAGSAASRAAEGVSITVTATPGEEFVFGGWVVTGGGVELSGNPATFTMPAGDVTAKAGFVRKDAPRYSIEITDDGNGTAAATVDGNPVTEAAEGVTVTLTAVAVEGYVFDRWVAGSGNVEISDGTANPATFTMPAAGVSVGAEFVEIVQNINVFDKITDESFLMYCRDIAKFDTNDDGILSIEEAAAVKDIRMNDWYSVVSLAGIEYFTSLEHLSAYSNLIEEVDLSSNTALTHLHLGTNFLTELDVSNNTKLVKLYCNRNPILELDLSNLHDLEVLYTHDCQNLTSLDISHNPKLTVLQGAYMYDLTSLDASNNPALESMDIYRAKLTSLDLSSCSSLKFLACSFNRLTSLDVSHNTALETLDCYGNHITSLDISDNRALWWLGCYNNRMTELDITSMTINATGYPYNYNLSCGLQTSDGTTEQILTLTMRDDQKERWYSYSSTHEENRNVELAVGNIFDAITDPAFKAYCAEFDTDGNGILTLEEARAVTMINAGGKGIASMAGLEYFTNITVLSCPGNSLSSLDVSKNTKLTNLICLSNQITSLDISKCTDLFELICAGNRMATLDGSKMANPDSYTIMCGNQTTDGTTMQTLVLTLRDEQKAQWENLRRAGLNNNVVLAD